MIDFISMYPDRIIQPFFEHIELVIITLVISIFMASVLTVIAMKVKWLGHVWMSIFSVIYSIPSLALFALLIPFTGLGKTSAVIVLVLYNQYLLLRNFISGLNQVDPAIQEAARGMGLTDIQTLIKIQIPLAKRALFAGIRLSVVSTIGIGTIAACINAGGLGTLLFDGLRTMNTVKILWGSLLSAGLAVLMNACLKKAEGGL